MNRDAINKIAKTQEDSLLLAKIWDKIQSGIRRNILTNTAFLSPRELDMARYLFGKQGGLTAFGGYADAERNMLIYLPDYLSEDVLGNSDSPIACMRATFYERDTLTHRDFLGALLGAGISRESVGDICVGSGQCDFFVTSQIAPYILQNFTSAGRTKLRLSRIALEEASIPQPDVKEIRDTLASLRLDSVLSAGFRIGRSLASESIRAGKVAIDGLPCEKPEKAVAEGSKISLRGSGKIKLVSVNGQTKKGRISVVIHRYI